MRRETAIHNFYKAYGELKKCKNVRLHIRTAFEQETLIEIDRYSGDERKERILRVEQEETEAYERATEEIKNMLQQIKEA